MAGKITPEIMSYINEIAEKMKNGRASLMIGAGFSKNAVPNMPTNKKFLTWNELGDVFYEKLYNHKPESNERYLNVLKLAEEVDATFGRTVLNQLIKDNLPDTEYSPSELHEKLLRLEWKDIFTTNYDTLLERTQARITDKRYNIILNKEDLVYSKEPRIIKLHGSFPSTTPFVITEEDYRQYPKKSAVFVNTVQQALIENILCLIGFSGDDPNFLQWIGWIRDNIGKELASKIYMIGVFDFSDAQIRNLANKNITVINMAHCFKEKAEPKIGLDLFVETLSKLNSKNDSNNWPTEKHIHIPIEGSDIKEDLKKLIIEWKKTRENYPGWYILPAQKRKNFTVCTNSDSVMYHINKEHTDIKTSLEFLFEYNWRRNKCLLPLDKSDIKTYEKVVWGINPFFEQIKMDDNSIIVPDANEDDWSIIAFHWIELALDLLVGYRENGQFEGTDKIVQLLEKILQFMTKEQVAKFSCEKVKIALFKLNIKKAKEELNSWKNDVTLPSWEMKRAGLLMEMSDVSQAYKIITDELNYIRQNYTKEIDYYSMSLESYLVALASYAKQAMSNFEARLKGPIEKQDKRDEVAINRFNPYEETRLFEAYLKERPKEKEYKTENFELNLITTTMISSGDESAQIAFQFIKYYEEIGMPFNCNHIVSSKEAAKEAVIRINSYAPLWSLILQIRIGDKKIADDVWSRKVIGGLSNEEIKTTGDLCIKAIKNNYEIIEKSDCWNESNFQLGIAALMPEVLSRLSTRMSDEMKIKTLNILKKMYKSEKILNYQNINKLTNRLMKSMSEKIKIKCFDTLMNFDLYIPKNAREELEINDLFESFNYQEKSVEKFKSVKIEKIIIDDLIKMLDSNESRKLAIVRLNFLNRFNLLPEESKKVFTEKLWSQVDENGLPIIPSRYLKNYYFYLPEPEDVNSKNIIKKYILSLAMPVQQSKGISSSSLTTPELLQQLESCTYCKNNEEGILWEIEEINDIINKITASWENDKKYILEPEDCLFKEELINAVKINYRDVDCVLSKVILSNSSYKVLDNIKTLSEELKNAGLPYLQLWVLSHAEDDNSELADYIYDNICSSDVTIIQNACNIAYNILDSGIDNNDFISLLEKISLNIKMRRGQGLLQIIYFMYNLLYSDVLPYDDKLLDNLLFGLERLAFETKLEVNTLRNSVNNCINLRAASCALAYIIYSKFEQKEIRERLEIWKNISQDLSEFSEVRNNWLD